MKEDVRLKALEAYKIMDTLPEKEFDDIVELACALCSAPISLITLLDSDRSWFKAQVGIGGHEAPKELSLCQYTIQQPDAVTVINNALTDPRLTDNPFITGDTHIRFYAGAPLVTPTGEAIGTLCIVDTEPREFSEEHMRILRILADRVMKQLEMRKENLEGKEAADTANRKLEDVLSQLKGARKIGRFGSWECDLSNMHITWSAEMYGLFDVNEGTPVSMKTWRSKVHADDLQGLLDTIANVVTTCKPQVSEYRVLKGDDCIWHLATADIIADEQGKPVRMVGTIMDITLSKTADEHRAQYVLTLEEMLFAMSHKFRKPIANYLSMANVFKSNNLTHEQIMECVPYIDGFAKELDGYIHELNEFLHDKRVQLNTTKKVA